MVEFLFLAHQLRGNMCPFSLITLTKPLCLLFRSKISMPKILRNTERPHFIELTLSKGLLRAFLTSHRPKIMTVPINCHN